MVIKALGFLTIVGRGSTPDDSTLTWFPVVGAFIGLAVGGIWWGAAHLWPSGPAAAVAVVADLILTGMLHLDGLADTADGVLPHMERSRRLAVMSDPTVGAFGVGVVILVILLRWTSMTAITPNVFLIAGLWCVARSIMALTVRTMPYARGGDGLVSTFIGARHWFVVGATGGILAVGFGVLGGGIRGVVSVAAAVIAGAGVIAFCRRRLGGYTGDVLGAAGLVAETIGLLVRAAKW